MVIIKIKKESKNVKR